MSFTRMSQLHASHRIFFAKSGVVTVVVALLIGAQSAVRARFPFFCQVIVKMDLESGHFSASDRYKYLREKAWEQAYVLDKVGLGSAAKRDSL